MVNRIYTAVASVLIICASVAPASFAQAEDQPPEEAPMPAPLNAAPAGIARQDWQDVRDVVLSVPSPGGAAFQTLIDGCSQGCYGVSASMTLDGSYQLYSYDCGAGRCRGFATDMWRGLAQETKQAYIDSILDALVENFPNEPRYAVWLEGQDAKGYLGARVDLASNGTRRYRFMGR